MGPRQADGSLPAVDFMQLSTQSRLIDKGNGRGLPYAGAAPDLGCYETGLPSATMGGNGGTGGTNAAGAAGGAMGGAAASSGTVGSATGGSGAGDSGVGGALGGGAVAGSSSVSGPGGRGGRGGGAGSSGGSPRSGRGHQLRCERRRLTEWRDGRVRLPCFGRSGEHPCQGLTPAVAARPLHAPAARSVSRSQDSVSRLSVRGGAGAATRSATSARSRY